MRKVAPITLVADGNTRRMSDTLTDNHWAIGGELRRISFRGNASQGTCVSRTPEAQWFCRDLFDNMPETRAMLREATISDVPAIRGLMQRVTGFWQPWWSD
jgi:hypothetical protein